MSAGPLPEGPSDPVGDAPPRLRSLDLFSGCGGLTHALRDVASPLAYCEIDPVPRAMLDSLMRTGALPRAPVHADVTRLDGAPLRGAVDLIVGGFPCTAISASGTRTGLAHPATGLFRQIVRLAGEIRPDYLFMENVGAISDEVAAGRSVLDDVVEALHEAGYDSRWTTVPAYQLGAPMSRFRWFCLCRRRDSPRAAVVRFGEWTPFDWSREPVRPRMVPPSDSARRRVCTLGNSVVPDCATLAFRALWTGLAVPLDRLAELRGAVAMRPMPPPGGGERHRPKHGFGGPDGRPVRVAPPAGTAPRPERRIPLDPRVHAPPEGYRFRPSLGTPTTRPILVRTWPSPRYQNGWSGSHVLTRRSRSDLGTVVRFATDDPAMYGPTRGGYTNPEFVEWLMGYPRGWTETAAEAPAAGCDRNADAAAAGLTPP